MAEKRVAPGPGKASGVVKSSQSGSKNGFYILIAVVAIAGIATLSYLSAQNKKSTAIAITTTPSVRLIFVCNPRQLQSSAPGGRAGPDPGRMVRGPHRPTPPRSRPVRT